MSLQHQLFGEFNKLRGNVKTGPTPLHISAYDSSFYIVSYLRFHHMFVLAPIFLIL
jgi:hypothetical protein